MIRTKYWDDWTHRVNDDSTSNYLLGDGATAFLALLSTCPTLDCLGPVVFICLFARVHLCFLFYFEICYILFPMSCQIFSLRCLWLPLLPNVSHLCLIVYIFHVHSNPLFRASCARLSNLPRGQSRVNLWWVPCVLILFCSMITEFACPLNCTFGN